MAPDSMYASSLEIKQVQVGPKHFSRQREGSWHFLIRSYSTPAQQARPDGVSFPRGGGGCVYSPRDNCGHKITMAGRKREGFLLENKMQHFDEVPSLYEK